jgi:16S rRNA (uracil1498-N3)-methyltransferase
VNLLLLHPGDVSEDGIACLSGARANHLLTVLRVTAGQQVRIGVIDGPCGVGTVTAAAEGRVDLRCALEAHVPPKPHVDLLLALPRPKVMRRLWAQLAALGVGQIVLTNAARVERHYFDTHVLTPDCYRPLLIEGLQQARDTRLPVVSIHRQFRVLVEDDLDRLFPDGLRLVAHPGSAPSLTDVVLARRGQRILLALGPEGGWNDFELNLMTERNFQIVSTGTRTLRSDTAAVAMLAMATEARRREGTQSSRF